MSERNGNHGTPGSTELVLADGVQVYSNGEDEIRIRKGVWNYEEAILDLSDVSQHQRDAVLAILEHLRSGGSVDTADLTGYGDLTTEELEQLTETIDGLSDTDYLAHADELLTKQLLYRLLGGSTTSRYFSEIMADDRPVLFFADSDSVVRYAEDLARDIHLPLEVMSGEEMRSISQMDLTTRFEAYEVRANQEQLAGRLTSYCAVVGVLERPRVTLLRNLNRALIETSTPLVFAAMDGPFTTAMAIKPPETGCFECYEGRLKARLDERPLYEEFVQGSRLEGTDRQQAGRLPLLHGLASQAILEGFLLQQIGRSRLAGRVQSTYIPVQEIQNQDLLRVPYCPACGFVSKAHMEEMYLSTGSMVDSILQRVEIAESQV